MRGRSRAGDPSYPNVCPGCGEYTRAIPAGSPWRFSSGARHLTPFGDLLEDALALGQNLVQRVGEVGRAVRQLLADLVDVLVPRLIDFLFEVALERAFLEAEAAVDALLAARDQEFRENASMVRAIKSASVDAATASGLIEEANDTAFFDMTLSGEQTIATIDETLTRLVDEDFNQFQTALSIRGEINLVTGLSIAFGQRQSSQLDSIIVDLATSAIDRLNALVAENQDVVSLQDVMPPLVAAIDTYGRVFSGGTDAPPSSDVLAARLAVDTALSPALDDINFNSPTAVPEPGVLALVGLGLAGFYARRKSS